MRRVLGALARALLPAGVRQTLRGRLRRLHLRFIVSRFAAYDARHRYGDQSFVVHIADPLARGWYDHDWDAGTELTLLQSRGRLQPGARVFDVGAHQGVVALMIAGMVGRSGQVIAVEAVPHNALIARRNAAANSAPQLEVVHAAIGDRDGTLWFEEEWNGWVSPQPGIGVQVESVTIDTLTARHGVPQVLFIDVEGYELHALRGAARTLTEHQPDLYVEAHVGAGLERFGSVADLLALIPAGYELFVAPGEAGDFVSLADGRALLDDRFRLVAFAPRTSEIRDHD
jgi:FkbM family methyltransferase